MRAPRLPSRPAAALCVLFALLCAEARADSVADEADFRFRRGATLYRQRRFDDALSEFLASNRLVKNKNVLFNIARCFELLAQYNEAYRWYVDILDEQGVSEADKKEVNAALERMRPSVALLQVASDPPGAAVFVDRKDLGERGQTPVTLALPAGKVSVMLELPGYRPAKGAAALAIGRSAVVKLALERIYGELAVTGEPATFELRADDPASAVLLTSSGSAKLLPGRHLLFATARGHVAQQLNVEVPADGTAKLSFKLAPLPPPAGALVVRASIDGALVRVDGKEVGFTPDVVENVTAGRHKLEVLAEGREPFVRSVDVKANERSFIDARLRYALPKVSAAERSLTVAEDAPASVTLITADEIRGFGYATLAEALRSVRGFYASDDRTYPSLGVRGNSAPGSYNNKLLVLSDGHVTNDLSNGQSYVGTELDIDLSDVDHIEIVRGPGSVLYGSNAFFAVINVVHRVPASGGHVGGVTQVDTLGGAQAKGAASWAGAAGYISVGAGGLSSSGEPIFASPATTGTAVGFAQGVDTSRAGHVDLHARLGDLAVNAAFNTHRQGVPTAPFDTVFGLPGTEVQDQRLFAEATFNHTFASGFGVDLRGSVDEANYKGLREYRGSTLGVPDALGHQGQQTRDADWAGGELRVRLPVIFGNAFFIGGEAQNLWNVTLGSFIPASANAAQGTTRDVSTSYSESIVSAFIGDDLRLSARANLKAAVRLDDHLDSFGVAVDPRIALIVRPYDGGNTKLIYSTAFRAPSVVERYFSDGVTQVAATAAAAAGKQAALEPEKVQTGELEHVHQLGSDVTVLVAGYWSRIDHIIRLKQLKGSSEFAFSNRSTLSRVAGAEAEVRWQPAPGALLAFWYAFAHATDDNHHDVPNSPSHTGAVRVLLPLIPGALSLSTEAIYSSLRTTATDTAADGSQINEQQVGETLFWNAGVSGESTRFGIRYGAFVENLLDQKPVYPAGLEIPFPAHAVPQLGRTMRFQLGASF